jgi:Plasmid encoded RepA protein
MPKEPKGLTPAGEILPAIIKPETKLARLLSVDQETLEDDIVFQHSVLCQTSMPYRDPGDAVRLWKRRNGRIRLELQAGRLLDPRSDDFVDIGLPFGPKPRLVLYHLNTQALRTQSPHVELEDSLTAFVQRTLGLDPKGRNIRTVRDQLNRLAAADFRLGATDGVRAVTVKGTVIRRVELWTVKDPRQRVLWPTTVQFSPEYFESLCLHAVPLNEHAVTYLAPSAMAMDGYTWLAQRLHRVPIGRPALVPWIGTNSLMEQFGQGYGRLRNFKRFFEHVLRQIKAVYPEARFTVDEKGMTLRNSPPPVAPRAQLK